MFGIDLDGISAFGLKHAFEQIWFESSTFKTANMTLNWIRVVGLSIKAYN